ncbi:MAG TPA: sensor histidine kinase, partial [Longilinea sp.]|nr:sensor histidine kinase [Longilinea sp.]
MALEKVKETNPVEEFHVMIEDEIDHSQKALKEVSLMLEQSQAELNKLVQRNTSISSQLQQIQGQFDTVPRDDIRNIYSEAMEAQQRLLVMRGQLEKLQGEQTSLKKYIEILQQTQTFLGDNKPTSGFGGLGGDGGGNTSLEMLINAQESERQRLSRQMHDGPAQALSNFIVQAEIAARLFELDPNRAKEELNNLKTSAMSTFQKVRNFIAELRPMMLDDLGLVPTLRRYLDSYKEQNGVDIRFSMKGSDKRLAPYLEIMIFRALQELLGNVLKHNSDQAGKLQINVQYVIDADTVKLTVADNGNGFDPETLKDSGGIGLKIIKERVELLGGTFEVDAAEGRGCSISFQIPSIEVKSETEAQQ